MLIRIDSFSYRRPDRSSSFAVFKKARFLAPPGILLSLFQITIKDELTADDVENTDDVKIVEIGDFKVSI